MDYSATVTGLEPLTIDTVKNYLKIDFDEDDLLLTDMITAAREQAEQITGLSLVEKTIVLFDDDYELNYELPFPEHNEVTSVKLDGTESLSSTQVIGNKVKKLILPATYTADATGGGLEVTYTTTGACPEAVKIALLKNIVEWYENRGNTTDITANQLNENTIAILTRFMRL